MLEKTCSFIRFIVRSEGISKLRLINDTGKLEHARSRDDDGKSMWDNRKRFVVVVGVVLLDHSSNRVREAMAEMYPCVAESDAWVRERKSGPSHIASIRSAPLE